MRGRKGWTRGTMFVVLVDALAKFVALGWLLLAAMAGKG